MAFESTRDAGSPACASSCPGFDGWFFLQPRELAFLRQALGEWLTSECGVDATVAGELVLAVHEVALQLGVSRDRESGSGDGFALRGDYDEDGLKLILVEPGPAGRARRDGTGHLSTILVNALVDRVEHQKTEWGHQVSLCRSTSAQVGEHLIH